MPMKAKRPCNHFGCKALVSDSPRCPEHTKQSDRAEYETKKSDPVWMMYQTPLWKKFRAWFLRLNPICMRVIDGVQCSSVADTVHHLISPRKRPDLFTDANNVAAVCRQHHHHGEGAQPGEEYVKSDTLLSLEERHEPN